MVIHITGESFRNAKMEACYVKVAKALAKSNRCMVVTGAGISCSAGIPDFRSANGLYNLTNTKNPKSLVKGKDIFDANLFRSPEATAFFYRFMGEFKSMLKNCKYTQTHSFIKRLHDSSKLLRCYTQNIDNLEDSLTLNMNLKPDPQKAQVVQLHGSMSRVVCTLAPSSHTFDFSSEYEEGFKNGEPPICPQCEFNVQERFRKGKRQGASGTLRPDIVLYNEFHPMGDVIGELQCRDLRKRPDFLLIMGTSLKIPGCKKLIKEASKSVHSLKAGLVVFVNLTEVSSEWDDIIDYHFQCSTDDWVHKIEPLFIQSYKPKVKNSTELVRSKSAVVPHTSSLSTPIKVESSEDVLSLTGSPSFGPKSLGNFSAQNVMDLTSTSPSFSTKTISPLSSLLRSTSASPGLPYGKPYTYQLPIRSIEDILLAEDDTDLALQLPDFSVPESPLSQLSFLVEDSEDLLEIPRLNSIDDVVVPTVSLLKANRSVEAEPLRDIKLEAKDNHSDILKVSDIKDNKKLFSKKSHSVFQEKNYNLPSKRQKTAAISIDLTNGISDSPPEKLPKRRRRSKYSR